MCSAPDLPPKLPSPHVFRRDREERMSGKRNPGQHLPSLAPLHPQEGFNPYKKPVGVAHPLRQHDQDVSKLTLKQLPPKQEELTPDFLRTTSPCTSSNSSNDELVPHTPPSPSHTNEYNLPYNKDYHVFVTHSTNDIPLVNHNLIDPLNRLPYNFKAVSSSDFREATSMEYNNDAIRQAMQKSCVIIIGLSETYVNSQRLLHNCNHY